MVVMTVALKVEKSVGKMALPMAVLMVAKLVVMTVE